MITEICAAAVVYMAKGQGLVLLGEGAQERLPRGNDT